MAYIAQQDLINALGASVAKAIFDDDNDGAIDTEPMAACLAYASAQVDAFIAGNYDVTLPLTNPPDIVKFAAVDFGCAYATRRRPDIVQAMGEKSWTDFSEAAIANMKMFAVGLKRLPEATAVSAANGGGLAVAEGPRIISSSADGTVNMGDF